MKLPPTLLRAKKEISGGLSTQHPIKLAAGLALCAALFTWTAPHVIPTIGDGEGASVAVEPVNTDTDRNDPAKEGADYRGIQNSSVGTPQSNREQVEQIEHKIDSLLAKDARTPFKTNTLLNREVKRLDQQIDAKWLAAAVDL